MSACQEQSGCTSELLNTWRSERAHQMGPRPSPCCSQVAATVWRLLVTLRWAEQPDQYMAQLGPKVLLHDLQDPARWLRWRQRWSAPQARPQAPSRRRCQPSRRPCRPQQHSPHRRSSPGFRAACTCSTAPSQRPSPSDGPDNKVPAITAGTKRCMRLRTSAPNHGSAAPIALGHKRRTFRVSTPTSWGAPQLGGM